VDLPWFTHWYPLIPIDSMVDLSIVFCKRLPGRVHRVPDGFELRHESAIATSQATSVQRIWNHDFFTPLMAIIPWNPPSRLEKPWKTPPRPLSLELCLNYARTMPVKRHTVKRMDCTWSFDLQTLNFVIKKTLIIWAMVNTHFEWLMVIPSIIFGSKNHGYEINPII